MNSPSKTVTEYINSLPVDRKIGISKLRDTILKHIPKGFSEGMGYGMPGFVVPHSLYPKGYCSDPKQPLPFISFASQKNHIAFYHMGIYADKKLLDWFVEQWPKHSSKKLDMGKSCIRFKKEEDIPYQLIGELVSKISAEEWIKLYEEAFNKK
jgi:hypothetical protein